MQRCGRGRRMGRDVGIDEHSGPVVAAGIFPADAAALRPRAEVDHRQGGSGEGVRGTAARRRQKDGQGGFVLAGGTASGMIWGGVRGGGMLFGETSYDSVKGPGAGAIQALRGDTAWRPCRS